MIERRKVLLAIGASLSSAALWLPQPFAQQPAAPATPPTSEPTRAGQVATGTASAMLEAAQPRRLDLGSPVFVRDTVRTGATERVKLQLGAATTLALGPSARLRIDQMLVDSGADLELAEGGLLFDRPPPSPGQPKSETRVRSPYGLISIRGTRFYAGPSDGVFGVFVARGAVDVTGGGRTVRVNGGQGTSIIRHGAGPSTPMPWGERRIRAALIYATGAAR